MIFIQTVVERPPQIRSLLRGLAPAHFTGWSVPCTESVAVGQKCWISRQMIPVHYQESGYWTPLKLYRLLLRGLFAPLTGPDGDGLGHCPSGPPSKTCLKVARPMNTGPNIDILKFIIQFSVIVMLLQVQKQVLIFLLNFFDTYLPLVPEMRELQH